MKKYLGIILILTIVAILGSSANATTNERTPLSTLTDEECIAFLEDSGVEIPAILDDDISWALFVRTIIEKVEANPDVQFFYSYSVIAEFASDIKSAVIDYYGIDSLNTFAYIESDEDILQDSERFGAWQDNFLQFNCYEYAIDTYTLEEEGWLDPGELTWVSMGNEAADYYYNCYANMYTIATWVKTDLESIGCTVNAITTTIPSVAVSGHTNLICVRKDADGIPWYYDNEGELHYFHDYHFMKLASDGNWYHKPGATNLLKYKYVPSNGRDWLSEGYNGSTGKYGFDEDVTYESEIYFIEYTTPHEWAYAYFSPGWHLMTCTICGMEDLGICEAGTPNYLGLESHQAACSLCGGLFPAEACTKEYVHSYDDTLGDVHEEICTVCNHVYTAQESCEFAYTDNEDGTHSAECTVCGYSFEAACACQWAYSGSGTNRTHSKECADCGYCVTESCAMAYRFHERVNGKNMHIYSCGICGHSDLAATACVYGVDDVCRFCKTPKNFAPINRYEEEILDA